MDLNAKLKLSGKLQILVNGEVRREVKNLVVNPGKEWVAGMMTGVGSVMSHMGVGTDITAADVGQEELVFEIDRNALTVAGGTLNGASIEYSSTWQDGDGEGALTEAGIFDNISGGSMLSRTVFDVINKGPGDVMTIVWTITVV